MQASAVISKCLSAGYLSRAMDLFVHPARHMSMIKAVRAPVFRVIRKRQPQLTRKYLNPKHLVSGWTSSQRSIAMIHHYQFLENHLSPACLVSILNGTEVWKNEEAAGSNKLHLSFSDPTDNEGELSFTYSVEGISIYVMSFSFVPGGLVMSSARTVILITRIQGAKEHFELIRACSKSMHGLAITAIFMAAMQGLAERLGLDEACGIRAEVQVCLDKNCAGHISNVYDNFFESIGGIRAGNYFQIALPLEIKSMMHVKSSNRGRVRRQREMKQQVMASMRSILETRQLTIRS